MSLTKVSYSMIGSAPYNVKDFGAVGDGVADDTAAIQTAMNAAKFSSALYFPAGVYKITDTLVIAAFESEGLNPMQYGIVCYDKWDDYLDEDGNVIREAGDRYGIRYEELLAFIISAI